jgi:uncharacterized short protein YbdD (DUF466 family)
VRDFFLKIAATLRLMVGVGDYDAYVRHCVEHHPEAPVLSRKEWYRARVDARYGGKKGVHRCPC